MHSLSLWISALLEEREPWGREMKEEQAPQLFCPFLWVGNVSQGLAGYLLSWSREAVLTLHP